MILSHWRSEYIAASELRAGLVRRSAHKKRAVRRGKANRPLMFVLQLYIQLSQACGKNSGRRAILRYFGYLRLRLRSIATPPMASMHMVAGSGTKL